MVCPLFGGLALFWSAPYHRFYSQKVLFLFAGLAISPTARDPVVLFIIILFFLLLSVLIIGYICFSCRKRICTAIAPTFVRRSTVMHRAKKSGVRVSVVSFVTVDENKEWGYSQTKPSETSLQTNRGVINFINKCILHCCCYFNYPTEEIESPGHVQGLVESFVDKFKTQRVSRVKGSEASFVSAKSDVVDAVSYKTRVSRDLSASTVHRMHSRIVHYCNKYIFRCCCCLNYELEK